MMGSNEILQQAISHHRAGLLHEAEGLGLYLNILQTKHGRPDANHNLGLMALQLGKAKLGLPHLHAAWEADPYIDQYWLSLTDTKRFRHNLEKAYREMWGEWCGRS